jgi:hypothetical protein
MEYSECLPTLLNPLAERSDLSLLPGAAAGGGAKAGGPLVVLQSKWAALEETHKKIVLGVAAAALVGTISHRP